MVYTWTHSLWGKHYKWMEMMLCNMFDIMICCCNTCVVCVVLSQSLDECSDLWLEHDAWMSLCNKLPGLEVLFPVCAPCFFVRYGIFFLVSGPPEGPANHILHPSCLSVHHLHQHLSSLHAEPEASSQSLHFLFPLPKTNVKYLGFSRERGPPVCRQWCGDS